MDNLLVKFALLVAGKKEESSENKTYVYVYTFMR